MRPYGILLVSGKLTHQENYCQQFAADTRCHLVAVTDEKDVDTDDEVIYNEPKIDVVDTYISYDN